MTALVVNCSKNSYNLGALKLADWLRAEGRMVTYANGDPGLFAGEPDAVYLSVIFSWHAPLALEIASRFHCPIECGGPGMFALGKWWRENAGFECHRGLDDRFERQRGDYKMTFASRGCPVGCSFCIVPRLEGLEMNVDWDFIPAPVLCDNNLSALPVDFQDHIIRRYRAAGMPLLDANSGFEPLTFDEQTFARWEGLLRGPWRFAFDTTSEEPQVRRMMALLHGVRAKRKQVYVLIGNESVSACFARAQKVIVWGGEPYCQPMMPLNALGRDQLHIAYDWSAPLLKDMARYYNRHLWRSFGIEAYEPRRGERPFASLGLDGRQFQAS